MAHNEITRWKDSFSTSEVVPIVHDAMVAIQGQSLGKMAPLVVLDTRQRRDVIEAVRSHRYLETGDVSNEWAIPRQRSRQDTVYLRLRLVRPVECAFALKFDLRKWAGFVDSVVQNDLLCIQPGEPGDGLYDGSVGRLTIQIGSKNFAEDWEKLYYKSVVAEFRRRGLERKESRDAARLLITQHRKFAGFQLPG